MEIRQEKIKYKRVSKREKNFSSNYKKNLNNLTESIFPLPWTIWPYEAKILIVLIGIWSTLGICILGSSSWWGASREMGNWAYFLKKQIIWTIPGIGLFYWQCQIYFLWWSNYSGIEEIEQSLSRDAQVFFYLSPLMWT